MIPEQTTFQTTPKWRLSELYFTKTYIKKMENYLDRQKNKYNY